MKKILFILVFMVLFSNPAFSDTKISAFTADTSPTSDDLMVTVNDPGGTPANRKVTLGDNAKLSGWIDGGTNVYNVTTSDNVGIGLTTPTEKLDVLGTVKATAFSGDGSLLTGVLSGGWTDGGTAVYLTTSTDFVGIGTTNPISPLEIKSSTIPAVIRFTYTGDSSSAISNAATINIIQDDGAAAESGHTLGEVAFTGVKDGIHTRQSGALIYAITSQDWTSSAAGTNLLFSTVTSGTTTISERMRIEQDGDVGIGTSTIGAQLTVEQVDAADSFRVNDSASDTSPFVIDASGNVGIGTAIPTSGVKLDVRGLIVPTKVTADPCTAGSPEGAIFYNDTSNYYCYCNGTDDVKMSDDVTACF